MKKGTLVVVLPHFVWQWAAEFLRVSHEFDVHVYFSDSRAGATPVPCEVIDVLTRNHRAFSGSNQYNKTVIITSYHTLSQRNGPSRQAEWLIKEKNDITVNPKDPPIHQNSDWPRRLSGLFHTMVLDEAHQVRNLTTYQSVALRGAQADFTLLLTATPLFNSVDDFKGYMPFLLKDSNDLLSVNSTRMRSLWMVLRRDFICPRSGSQF